MISDYQVNSLMVKKAFTFVACGKRITRNTPAKPMTSVTLKSCGSFLTQSSLLRCQQPSTICLATSFTFNKLMAIISGDKTRQGYAACSTLKPAGYLFSASRKITAARPTQKVNCRQHDEKVTALLTPLSLTSPLQAKLHEFYILNALEGEQE
ncbi:hypothetical protein [Oceanimonas smirnovii]|uniref:Uncharacterized protein n=1 Tax=Oceanimonas smirnovii TaxID=264574 RepID=A0ABW7P5N7_9GAMM